MVLFNYLYSTYRVATTAYYLTPCFFFPLLDTEPRKTPKIKLENRSQSGLPFCLPHHLLFLGSLPFRYHPPLSNYKSLPIPPPNPTQPNPSLQTKKERKREEKERRKKKTHHPQPTNPEEQKQKQEQAKPNKPPSSTPNA